MSTRTGINLITQIGVHGINGQRQVMKQIVAGATVSVAGTATATVTNAGLGGSPLAVNVPLLVGDTLAQQAAKVAAALNADAAVFARWTAIPLTIDGVVEVYMQRRTAVANDATAKLALAPGTSTGMTADATARIVTAGVADDLAAGGAISTFSGVEIEISDEITTKQYQAAGYKNKTTNVQHKQFSSGSFKGPASYVELCVILAGMFPYTVSESGGVYTWTFNPNVQGTDLMTAYDLWQGDEIFGAERFAELIFASCNINFGLEEVSIDGSLYSKMRDDTDPCLWEVATQYRELPIGSGDINVYADESSAGFGTTQLTEVFDVKVAFPEKQKQKWVLDRANDRSYDESYEQIIDPTVTLMVEANAQGIAFRQRLLNNLGTYLMVEAVSEQEIVSSEFYTFIFKMFGKLRDIKDMKNFEGGIYAYQITLGVEIDTVDWGKGYEIVMKNALDVL